MIKVIACDMDGTLLNNQRVITERTLAAIRKATKQGIRFIITTGRNFHGAMEDLKETDIVCDYIVSSGAEIRNSKQEIVCSNYMKQEDCKKIHEILNDYPISSVYCTERYEYRIGTLEEVEESILLQIKFFHSGLQEALYRRIKNRTKHMESFEEFKNKGIQINKILLFSENKKMLSEVKARLMEITQIAVASSFPTNIEITDLSAQKGPVLKAYIEELGYSMNEVMALGDSLNDYSMLSMEFGATVAMGNADAEIKAVSKYVTKSNAEDGVAYAIEKLLEFQKL